MLRRPSLRSNQLKMPKRFTVMNMPTQDMALTSYTYVHPTDAESAYVTVGEGRDAYVYRCCPHTEVPIGKIAMNAIQRRMCRVFSGDVISVENFHFTFKPYDINALTVTVEWVKASDSATPKDLTEIANTFRTQFDGHVVSKGQKVTMMYGDKMLLVTIKSDIKGLITMRTEVGVEFFEPDVDAK